LVIRLIMRLARLGSRTLGEKNKRHFVARFLAAVTRMSTLYQAVQRLRPPAHDWNDALAATHSTTCCGPKAQFI
jgi:hypothetical protein